MMSWSPRATQRLTWAPDSSFHSRAVGPVIGVPGERRSASLSFSTRAMRFVPTWCVSSSEGDLAQSDCSSSPNTAFRVPPSRMGCGLAPVGTIALQPVRAGRTRLPRGARSAGYSHPSRFDLRVTRLGPLGIAANEGVNGPGLALLTHVGTISSASPKPGWLQGTPSRGRPSVGTPPRRSLLAMRPG